MRERLIKLLNQAEKQQSLNAVCGDIDSLIDSPRGAEFIADYLLENGVVVLPCKVGDKTFLLLEKVTGGYDIIESECVRIIENKYSRIFSMAFDCEEIGNTLEFHLEDFERWVFLTREDAERALKGETK